MKHQKATLFAASALSVVVLAAFVLLCTPRVNEKWLLARLKSGSAEQRIEAAKKLGRLRSVQAVPGIISAINEIFSDGIGLNHSGSAEEMFGALEQIGPPAIPDLLRCLDKQLSGSAGDTDASFAIALIALDRIYPGHSGGTKNTVMVQPLLEALRDDRTLPVETRELAQDASASGSD